MYITASKAARACTRGLITLSLAAIATLGVAQTPTAPQSPQQQRSAFRAAYAAAQAGKDWQPLAHGLEAYPLYPYLEAAQLQHDVATASRAEVDAYLARYAGLIPAADLRQSELQWAAQQKDWATFRHYYQPGLGDVFTCDALQAQLAAGQSLDFARDLDALWQKTSLPSACTPVLDAAYKQGLLTPQRVWERIDRTARAGRTATIHQSSAWLTGTDASDAARILAALQDPAKLLQQADTFTDTPHARAAVALALNRFARRDSAQAQTFWQTLSPRFKFGDARRDEILATLALYNAVDLGPDAIQRLADLPPAAQTDATREWRVRAAVAQGNWQAAATALQRLTPAEMQRDEWRYWQARVAQQLGQVPAALTGYTALASQATFYGFLAADQAHLPYSICPATLSANPALDQQVAAVPGIARAFEFFALDMLPDARREWNRAFADLAPDQKLQAAALASQRGWYDRAVFALAKSGDLDYYALRFPLADKHRVVTAARNAGINPAWAFAIIRAETAWQTDAQSGADARGLMQLLPDTASLVARRSGLTYAGADSLYDPAINIPLGTQYLANLATRFNGSPWLTTAAYNAGPGNAKRWVATRGNLDPEAFILTIPFNETRDYVTRVLSFATIYGWRLYGQPVPVSSRLPAIGAAYDPAADPPRKQVVCRAPAAASPAVTQGSP
jgi:soluble lytic murein transglycosylase